MLAVVTLHLSSAQRAARGFSEGNVGPVEAFSNRVTYAPEEEKSNGVKQREVAVWHCHIGTQGVSMEKEESEVPSAPTVACENMCLAKLPLDRTTVWVLENYVT